jgi:acetolactate synthase-1/2/3 large subunit
LKQAGIDFVCPHHEQAGVMAALARHRLNGKPAIMTCTGGPGAMNTLNGIADAFLDSIPCIVLAGQERSDFMAPDNKLRGKGIQGLRLVDVVEPITKFATSILDKNETRQILERAFIEAHSGRPGPVWIEIPQDVQWADVDPATLPAYVPAISAPAATDMRAAAAATLDLIAGAKRPLLWVGHGIRLAQSEDVFTRLFDSLGVPALVSWQAADLVPSDHPSYVGRAGTYGQRWANLALQNCDLLITLGTRLAIPQRGYVDSEFARAAKKVIVEIDPIEMDKFKFAIDVPVLGDVGAFLNALAAEFETRGAARFDFSGWASHCATWREKYPMAVRGAPEAPVNSYDFIDRLSDLLDADDVIVTDMGTSLTCTHATIRLKKGQRLVTSTGLGEMGFGLPGAIGAASGAPGRRVVLIAGEGSLMMNLQELQTAAHLDLPIKIALLNNNGYLTIKHTHRALYNEDVAPATAPETGVSFPDMAKVAAAFGFAHSRISQSGEIEEAVRAWLDAPGRGILEIVMPGNQELIPKSALRIRADGSMYSPPLEDMYPFLSDEELAREMIVPLLEKR